MKARLILALLSLLAGTIADDLTKNECHACIDGVCYGQTQSVQGDRFLAEDSIDIDNLMYFAYPNSNQINSLNLNDETDVKTVLIADYPILGLALNQTSRDLYYSVDNGDFFKYNLVTNQTVSILKPSNESKGFGEERPGFITLFISSNKLYATTNAFKPAGTHSYASLFEYVPQELQFKEVRSLRFEQLYDEPIVDSQGILYQRSWKLYTLPDGDNKTVLVQDSYNTPAAKSFGDIGTLVTDNGDVLYFNLDIRKLYRLDHINHELVLAGAFELTCIVSGSNDRIYVYSRMSYATANTDRCALKRFGVNGVKIEQLPKSKNG